MPDHFHWLMQLGEEVTLSNSVRFVKSQATKKLGSQQPLLKRVWQEGFHDHQIRQEEDLKNLARYILGNPLRAGLVNSVRNYSFWDAAWI
nr:transposase [Marinospirillum perlucidum]